VYVRLRWNGAFDLTEISIYDYGKAWRATFLRRGAVFCLVAEEKGSCPPADLATKLKLSEESVLFLIGKLVREGKLKITEVKL
jgi:hypothetical protein